MNTYRICFRKLTSHEHEQTIYTYRASNAEGALKQHALADSHRNTYSLAELNFMRGLSPFRQGKQVLGYYNTKAFVYALRVHELDKQPLNAEEQHG